MIDPLALEPVTARAWRAAEEAELGAWRLYASSGQSGRINACWPLGAPDRPVDAAIAAVEAWYRARGLTPKFKLAGAAARPPDLDRRLSERGYETGKETLTMVGPLALAVVDGGVALDDQPSDGFRRVFADPDFGVAADAEERLAALRRIVPPRAFARLDEGGQAAAIGVCAVEDDWAGVFAMRTAPAFRRRGFGRRIFASLAAFARQAGARRGYLQVEADNEPAVRLYWAAGFEEAYRYRYWWKPLTP
jgi:ribosomal protein S18 acetylase RimI-like enzyme